MIKWHVIFHGTTISHTLKGYISECTLAECTQGENCPVQNHVVSLDKIELEKLEDILNRTWGS